MPFTIQVSEICVKAAVDEAIDPHGQPGCSAIWAEFVTNDDLRIKSFRELAANNEVVVLKCARLEVEGVISKITTSSKGTEVLLAVDDLRYVIPPHPKKPRIGR
ncbi:MAG: hypothetical protein ACKVP0_24785 [Pirellulaceae bacterium]